MAETITAGGLEFMVENRAVGQDGGPSMQVLADVDGSKVQVLRFDMFHKVPHYHYAPTGENVRYNLDPLTFEDGIGWVMGLFGKRFPQLVAKAGYEALATSDTVAAVEKALPEIEARWRAQG